NAWEGKPENVVAAQRVFHRRARLNGLARQGAYQPRMEREA
ncbi:MAG: class I fructose-bisphosphate aldolase, partial [Casimicrobiaceae bacterium]